jgi:glycosyltransferase involved in cell wall biosynthesis
MRRNQLISLLMPAYNASKYIRKAIDNILDQTYTNFEFLIADDLSADNTKKIIDSYCDPRIKTFHNEKNLGYLETFNKLIALTKGDYITFQDADDYSAPKRLELLIEEFEKDKIIGICGSNFIRIDEKERQMEISDLPLTHNEILDIMPEKYGFIGSALMIKREVYEQIGGYHNFFNRMGQEDHYWAYLAMSKFKAINIPDHLYFYRFNPSSVSGNLSNNPDKLNSQKIIETLINQRKRTGTDFLEQGKDVELRKMLDIMNQPFYDDPSYFYYFVAKRRFYEGKKKLALKNLWKAIQKKPYKWHYYKDFLYFIRNNVK